MVNEVEEAGVFKGLEDGMRGLKLGGRIVAEKWFEIYELGNISACSLYK